MATNHGAATATPIISASTPPAMTATRRRRSMSSTVACASPTMATPDRPLVRIAPPRHTPASSDHASTRTRARRPCAPRQNAKQRAVGERDEREVVHRHLHEADRQRQRRVEDACQPAAPPAEDRARQQPRRDGAEQAEQQPGRPRRRFGEPERPQRSGERPEEEHRLVWEGLAEKSRRDVVAAFDHLLSDGRVQALVGIDERMVQDERNRQVRAGERRGGARRGERGGGVSATECMGALRPATQASLTRTARSGRSLISASAPQSSSRHMSRSSFTVHTCTGRPARCAARMKRRETTVSRPARSGTWKPR